MLIFFTLLEKKSILRIIKRENPMIHKFVMPKLGWTMETGKIVSWSKNEGDEVQKGEEILEIETDKVTIQVEAPESGVLVKILGKEGEEIPVNNAVALISEPGIQVSDDDLNSFIENLKKEEAMAASEASTSRFARQRPLKGSCPGPTDRSLRTKASQYPSRPARPRPWVRTRKDRRNTPEVA